MTSTSISTAELTASFTEQAEIKPAARIWTDPMPETWSQQVRFFNEHGFLILRQVLSPAELDALDRELDRLAEQAKLPRIREGFDLEPNRDADRKVPMFRMIGGISDLSKPFHDLLVDRRIIGMLHEIMGPTIQLWRDVCMMRPARARAGRERPWHQDSSYWPGLGTR